MDHDEVREQLELAATEPAGIDRLMAGDTPLAAAIAAHLAGCSSCTDELDRLRRAAIIIGDAVGRPRRRSSASGRSRSSARSGGSGIPHPKQPQHPSRPWRPPCLLRCRPPPHPAGFGRGLAWIGAIAAAVLIAVAATTFVLDRQFGNQLARRPGAARVGRARPCDSDHGRIVQRGGRRAGPSCRSRRPLGPRRLLGRQGRAGVIAGLTEPAGDREYRCWVEIDGQRTPVGKMFFGADLAFWAGPARTSATCRRIQVRRQPRGHSPARTSANHLF